MKRKGHNFDAALTNSESALRSTIDIPAGDQEPLGLPEDDLGITEGDISVEEDSEERSLLECGGSELFADTDDDYLSAGEDEVIAALELGHLESGSDDFAELESEDDEFKDEAGGIPGLSEAIEPGELETTLHELSSMCDGIFSGREATAESADGEYGMPVDSKTEGEGNLLSEELAAVAASADSEAEAQSLAGGVTIYIIQFAPSELKPIAPILIRRISRLVHALRRMPKGRLLIRTIPTIVRHTVNALSRRLRQRKAVTPSVAARVLAVQSRRIFANPRRTAAVLARNRWKHRQARKIRARAPARSSRPSKRKKARSLDRVV